MVINSYLSLYGAFFSRRYCLSGVSVLIYQTTCTVILVSPLSPTSTVRMSPISDTHLYTEESTLLSDDTKSITTALPETAILHRTPWVPAIAVGGKGVFIELEDGTRIIDAVGGAAVSCIGAGHPKVLEAIKEQLDRLTCALKMNQPPIIYLNASNTDVYNVQLSNQPSEKLAKRLIAASNGAFEQCIFVSGGSEAMEAVIKLARQYFWEINQRQRKYFIARHLSYHGNTLGALALSNHPGRRAPYECILNQDAFHHVSPAFYKRFAKDGESEEDYVARLAQELEDKFVELGPENVIACKPYICLVG